MGSVKKALGAGAGVAAAAAAAGAYFLYGKDAAENRRRVKDWMIHAKERVSTEMEKLKGRVDEGTYRRLADEASERFKKLKNLSREEVSKVISELQNKWKAVGAKVSVARGGKAKIRRPKKVSSKAGTRAKRA